MWHITHQRFNGAMCRALIAVCAAMAVHACTDDTFDQFNNGAYSEYVAFKAEVPGVWIDGAVSRSGDYHRYHDIDIDKIDDAVDGTPLYLITETVEASDSIVETPKSRGTEFVGKTIPSIGVSAICYGEWPEDSASLTTNFAHNIRLHQGGSYWAPSDDDQLRWTGSGRVKFYAYAPYSADFGTGEGKYAGSAVHSEAASGLPSLTFSVHKDDVTKQVDLLEATADCSGSYNSSVALKFSHALTAVTFKTGDNMLAGKVTKIELSGVHFKGTSVIGSKKWTADDDATSMTITLDKTVDPSGEGNHYAPSDKPITADAMTLFMLPQTLGADAKLTMTFTDELSDTERTLTASLAGKEWKAGTRVQYALSTTGIKVDPVITFDSKAEKIHIDNYVTEGLKFIPVSGFLHDAQLTAYADVYQLDNSSNKVQSKAVKLDYTIQYSLDGGDWKDADVVDAPTVLADEDVTKPMALKLQFPAQSHYSSLKEKMKPTTNGKGLDESGPYDLSGGGETANTYVIDDYGYYSLPLVYGNARGAGGATNESAYKGNSSGGKGTKFLKDFVKHDGTPITEPDITGAEDAVLVWQDQPGLVTDVKLNDAKTALTFRVEKESLNQGNAVVAVRGADGTIMWSWQIWATYKWKDSDCVTGYVQNAPKGAEVTEYSFAPCNLGYCDPILSSDSERKFKLRIKYKVADTGGEDEKDLGEFIQPPIEASYAGDNTYYQWGRKDPSIGGVWNTQTLNDGWHVHSDWNSGTERYAQYNMHNKAYYSDLYEYKSALSKVPLEQAIQEPYHHFMYYRSDDERLRHWGGENSDKTTRMFNAWNSANDYTCSDNFKSSQKEVYMAVAKTVYDPSPVGYHIPSTGAFMSLYGSAEDSKKLVDTSTDISKKTKCIVEKDKYSDAVVGWTITLYADDGSAGKTIYIPGTGLRDFGETENCPGKSRFPSGTNPAHAQVGWICTSSHHTNQCSLFYIDCRAEGKTVESDGYGQDSNNSINILLSSNNSYGFSVRPVKD